MGNCNSSAIWVSSHVLEWGTIQLVSTARGLCGVAFPWSDPVAFAMWLHSRFGDRPWKNPRPGSAEEALHKRALLQLEEYFAGYRRAFDLPLDLTTGTAFQQAVWSALLAIPYGQTRSYREVAQAVGRPSAVRAVGQANRANQLPVIVPCHRVIGSDGELRGYGGRDGAEVKSRLLKFEQLFMRFSADS